MNSFLLKQCNISHASYSKLLSIVPCTYHLNMSLGQRCLTLIFSTQTLVKKSCGHESRGEKRVVWSFSFNYILFFLAWSYGLTENLLRVLFIILTKYLDHNHRVLQECVHFLSDIQFVSAGYGPSVCSHSTYQSIILPYLAKGQSTEAELQLHVKAEPGWTKVLTHNSASTTVLVTLPIS